MADLTAFEKDIEALINSHSMENMSDTPDFILAKYLANCLAAFSYAVNRREQWYGRGPQPVPSGPHDEARMADAVASTDGRVTG